MTTYEQPVIEGLDERELEAMLDDLDHPKWLECNTEQLGQIREFVGGAVGGLVEAMVAIDLLTGTADFDPEQRKTFHGRVSDIRKEAVSA